MNSMYKLTPVLLIMVFAMACGSSVKENQDGAKDKKAELLKLKEEQSKLNKN